MLKAGIEWAKTDGQGGNCRLGSCHARISSAASGLLCSQMRKFLGIKRVSAALMSLPLTVLVLKRAPGAGGRHASLKEVYS